MLPYRLNLLIPPLLAGRCPGTGSKSEPVRRLRTAWPQAAQPRGPSGPQHLSHSLGQRPERQGREEVEQGEDEGGRRGQDDEVVALGAERADREDTLLL